MMKSPLSYLYTALLVALSSIAYGELKLPHLLSDHMVVQHDQPIHFWGWGEPGEKVTVEFNGESAEGTIRDDGTWSLKIAPAPPGGPYRATITSGESTLAIEDILSGEVWLASGQSNMEWALSRVENAGKHIADAHFPQIRSFKVPKKLSYTPLDNADARWNVASPDTVAGISAVGWFFAKEISETQNMPVGILQASWGGTYVEAWTPFAVLKATNPMLQPPTGPADLTPDEQAEILAHYETVKYLKDAGNRGVLIGWQMNQYDDKAWSTIELPGSIEGAGHAVDGAFWVRKKIQIPAEWDGKDLELSLGAIDDYDITWVNGKQIGATGPEEKDAWSIQRKYIIPSKVVQLPGGEPLQIAIRVFDRYGIGGFTGKESDLTLAPVDPTETDSPLSLSGPWKFWFETQSPDLSKGTILGSLMNRPNQPSVLFNAMISPLIPYPIRGAIWYQGESNSGRPEDYAVTFPDMIEAWREAWGLGEFPFLYVQLASFKDPQRLPSEGGWALIREAQQAALLLPNVAEAIILDAGEADDIHPRDKVTPAHRLALQARAEVYGEEIEYSSPYLNSWESEGATIHLHFAPVYEGLETLDKAEPEGFAIQDEEGTWFWAKAKIISPDTIELSHPEVSNPQAARYAWASNPRANVYNSAGLPLSPFRTDR
ncbi:MAG: sialate O-acetylesterase [Puniceicoccales bacterium]